MLAMRVNEATGIREVRALKLCALLGGRPRLRVDGGHAGPPTNAPIVDWVARRCASRS
jgi:hypothetical protein